MKVHRAGTNRKTADRLKRHAELMQKYVAEGMELCAASDRAFRELFGRAPGVTVSQKEVQS